MVGKVKKALAKNSIIMFKLQETRRFNYEAVETAQTIYKMDQRNERNNFFIFVLQHIRSVIREIQIV